MLSGHQGSDRAHRVTTTDRPRPGPGTGAADPARARVRGRRRVRRPRQLRHEPALAILAIGLDPTRALVLSQVVLSFGIPFALIPVVAFTRHRDLMGNLVNHPLTTAAAILAAALVILLNAFLLWQMIGG
ncbi:divalent metal cation transporter [Micromonospora sp. NPDC049366]|uniref:divalent metal cation transporter n=1 Tax=Micromonospora sp. NPDC049366 TaxID=3364271 RepID=UPI0037A95BC3